MKKIINIRRRVAALVMTFFLALGITAPALNITAKGEAIEVINGSCTIADTIFSYCASGGVAILNETVIDEVYNVLGSSFGTLQTFVDNGLLTYSDGTYVDSGLSTSINSAISNINSIDIGGLFNQTAEQNPAGVALTGASSLAGIAGSVASTGFLPVTAGVAVSGFCGFQIGNIIANMIGLYGEPIWAGQNITLKEMIESVPAGTRGYSYSDSDGNKYYQYVNNASGYIYYVTGVSPFFIFYGNGFTGNHALYTIKETDGVTYTSSQTVGFRDGFYSGQTSNRYINFNPPFEKIFNSSSEFYSYRSSLKNGTQTLPNTYSPDIIGQNGNVYGNYNNGNYTVPDANSQVDEDNQGVDPSKVSYNDWMDWADQVKQNNNNPDTDLDNNKNVFDDIKSKIIVPRVIPDPNPDPDPDPDPVPNPDPETVPAPDVNPYPDTYPVADPETVPDNKPQPEYTEKATENETDIIEGDPYTTPNLLDKFPFCIPRDILKVFKKLDSGARQAPHIQWRFNPNNMIDYTFDIDFSTWDSVAQLLRILELAAFIIALGIATRNLILS